MCIRVRHPRHDSGWLFEYDELKNSLEDWPEMACFVTADSAPYGPSRDERKAKGTVGIEEAIYRLLFRLVVHMPNGVPYAYVAALVFRSPTLGRNSDQVGSEKSMLSTWLSTLPEAARPLGEPEKSVTGHHYRSISSNQIT